MRWRGGLILIVGVAPQWLCAQAVPWRAGVAVTDITPPAFDAIADAQAFPLCPPGMTGLRPFAFEEPYRDVNGNGRFDYGVDEFCDANHNGRWDGIFSSGGVDVQATEVHDPLQARALAISDGIHTVVIESVVSQGLFINVINRIRARAQMLRPGIDDVIVSADHNESSPDTVGIYGAPAVAGAFGGRSGIDDYYIDFLVEQAARAAVAAFDAMRPATLWAQQFVLPENLDVRLSNNFPTTDDAGKPAAVDPKVGVLQARDAGGKPIFTLMNVAAHNQEIGHSPALAGQLSADWPGYFERALEQQGAGTAIYLVGDNGSEEDPQTVPPVPKDAGPGCPDGCYAQAGATGRAFADAVVARLSELRPLSPGSVKVRRREFFVPLENNLFKAAAAAGLFGDRQTYVDGIPAGNAGDELKTSVAVVDIGPDFQLIANPGEAFPALMLGSPWGIEEASCPQQQSPIDPPRGNPPVPTWHARAAFRFQAGLADDFIGYEIPAWAYSAEPGVFVSTCFNDDSDKDPKGHQHKLETEGVGPTASNQVAEQLTQLLDEQPDPTAQIRLGRFVRADGTLSRRPEQAVAVWIADVGSAALKADGGTLVALPGIAAFGSRRVDAHGMFMDYDGQAQAQADITTRGMLIEDRRGRVVNRYYVDVYPTLAASSLPAATASEEPRDAGLAARGAAGAWWWPTLVLLGFAAAQRRRGDRRRWTWRAGRR